MTGPSLRARGMVVSYGRAVVVRDVDLELRPGEVLALLGANGAGKTTSVMALAGAVPLAGGHVELRGCPPGAPIHERARRGLAVVTERRAVLMSLTVRENLRVARADLELALHAFPELEGCLDRSAGVLSGGQQQMLALARALGRQPSVLLIDELSLGLAPMVVDRLLVTVRAAADRGLAVLLVEQHVHKALRVADRVVVLRDGRVELEGPAAALRDQPEVILRAYLPADGSAPELTGREATGT